MKRPLTPREWAYAAVAFIMSVAALYVHFVNVRLIQEVGFYRDIYSNTVITITKPIK